MFALRVQFPHNWPGWHVPEYILSGSPNAPLPGRDGKPSIINTTVDSEMHGDYCSDSPVFRAYIRDADCTELLSSHSSSSPPDMKTLPTSSASITVALKFAMREDLVDDLAQEAAVYTGPLKSLQGKTIPRCFGFYTGVGEEGQQIGCLALEFWGEGLGMPFQLLPIDVRVNILKQLGELHRCGVHHGDFAERNVLAKNNDIRLIDFDQIEEHECDCDPNLDFQSGSKLTELGCPILWEIGWDMGLWEDLDGSDTSGSDSSGSFGPSFGSTSSSESDLALNIGSGLARDLSLDEGREG